MADYTTSELMVARASKELKDGDVVFVGIGVPSLAVNLAYRRHAPGICMIYESGAVGCVPKRLPISGKLMWQPVSATVPAACSPGTSWPVVKMSAGSPFGG